MSLFPAYADTNKQNEGERQEDNVDETPPSWLQIESFNINITDIPLPKEPVLLNKPEQNASSHQSNSSLASDQCKFSSKPKTHYGKKKKKKEEKRKKQEPELARNDYEDVYEDKDGVRGYLTVKTLTRPLVPLYSVIYRPLGSKYRSYCKKSLRKKRYYVQVLENPERDSTMKKLSTSNDKDNCCETRIEEDLSKQTAEFNKVLTDDPHNIDMWLQYVQFQDVIQQFERAYRRGGGAKSIRVTTERKILILDKALVENPSCEKLLQKRFHLAESMFPADILSQQLAQMVERSPNSIVLWRSYIRVTQGSLSLCNTTAVMKLYEQGMKRLHQLRRGAPAANTLPMEVGILDLLLECTLFLRQAGLWEQLWTLLKIYLELNLAQPDTELFKNFVSIPEDYITDLEETVLQSQLPLPELWYRIERLREAVHWLPWSSDSECEDPQRLVFVDDVSDMLHPITSTGLSFRLVLIALSVLKVPLLPSRHTTMQFVGLDQIPSQLDCVESLLAMFYPQNTIILRDKTFLQGALNLVYGPQYLTSSWPGQEQYLEFIVKLFKSCIVCFNEPLKTAMSVWWLRFERYLLILDKHEHCKLPPQRKKKIKSVFKDFLKNEENRNNSLFYLEYAQFEYENGEKNSACKVLNTAIIAHGQIPVISIVCERKKAELCRLYRILSEFFLKVQERDGVNCEEFDRQKAVNVLVALGLGTVPSKLEASPTPQQIEHALCKFRHITTELLVNTSTEAADGTEHLLPDFIVDWIACYSWLLTLTRSVWEAGAVFEEALQKIHPAKSPTSLPVLISTCQREGLYESYVSLLCYYCGNNVGVYSVLQEVLHRALQEFPSNLHLLAVIANIETTFGCIGSSWWKMTKYFKETDSLFAQIFQIFLMRFQGTMLELATQENHDFLGMGGPILTDPSVKNRLSALYSRLLCNTSTKRCPMLWRLYLRFLAEHGKETSYHSTFYRAVEECPWVKVLFVEAVKLLPAELPQLQDLLIEKELRIHVTPEELDILRRDPTEVV